MFLKLLKYVFEKIIRFQNDSNYIIYTYNWAALVAQEQSPLAMQEMWVQSLRWEDPLEQGIAAHSSILAWRISWTQEPGGVQ